MLFTSLGNERAQPGAVHPQFTVESGLGFGKVQKSRQSPMVSHRKQAGVVRAKDAHRTVDARAEDRHAQGDRFGNDVGAAFEFGGEDQQTAGGEAEESNRAWHFIVPVVAPVDSHLLPGTAGGGDIQGRPVVMNHHFRVRGKSADREGGAEGVFHRSKMGENTDFENADAADDRFAGP